MSTYFQAQVDEIHALQSLYPEPGAVDIDPIWLSIIDNNQNENSYDGEEVTCARGSVILPNTFIQSKTVGFRFCLPKNYPDTRPDIQIICDIDRKYHDRLSNAALTCTTENCGMEVLLMIAQSLIDVVDEIKTEISNLEKDKARITSTVAKKSTKEVLEDDSIGRLVFWFHHIKSVTKRKCILHWAHELDVRGFSKPGYPGVIICEGLANDIKEYRSRIKNMRWKAIAIRAEEFVSFEAGRSPNDMRQFKSEFKELGEGDLGVLSTACKEAGLSHLCNAALKL